MKYVGDLNTIISYLTIGSMKFERVVIPFIIAAAQKRALNIAKEVPLYMAIWNSH